MIIARGKVTAEKHKCLLLKAKGKAFSHFAVLECTEKQTQMHIKSAIITIVQ